MKKEDLQIKLSIIIPYYKTLESTFKLMSVLSSQLNDNVEIIIVDDGCNQKELDKWKRENIHIIHLPENSGGASVPRNVGLDNAKGEYITFIDADDLVEINYIDTILTKINNENFDHCYFGWKSPHFSVLIKDEPPEWNHSVWNCIYKRETIGNERFNPNLVIAEDYDFNKRVRKGKKANLTTYLYYYNDTPNSLGKRGKNNE